MTIHQKKQQLLHFLKNETYIRIKPSKIHGVGIFAIRDIPKDIDPFKSLLHTAYIDIEKEELNDLPDEIQKMIHDYCAEEDDKVFIPEYGFNPLDILRFINHSDTPNVKTIDDGTNFVTTREIKKGEELVSNYAHYDVEYEKKM